MLGAGEDLDPVGDPGLLELLAERRDRRERGDAVVLAEAEVQRRVDAVDAEMRGVGLVGDQTRGVQQRGRRDVGSERLGGPHPEAAAHAEADAPAQRVGAVRDRLEQQARVLQHLVVADLRDGACCIRSNSSGTPAAIRSTFGRSAGSNG